MGAMDAEAHGPALDALVAGVRTRLEAADAPRVRLGAWIAPRRVLGVPRAARLSPVASAWHLGAVLIGDDAAWLTGEVVRAGDPGRRGYTAASQRRRAELALAALQGGFAEGEEVHVDWRPLDLADADAPVRVSESGLEIRWSPRAGWMPLQTYLDERAALLIDPPAGA